MWWDLEVDDEIVDTVLDEDISDSYVNSTSRGNADIDVGNSKFNKDVVDVDRYDDSMKLPDPIVYEFPPDPDNDDAAAKTQTPTGKPYSVSRIYHYKKLLKKISDPGYLHVAENNQLLKNNVDIKNMHATIDINDASNFKYDNTKSAGKGARGLITSYIIKRYRLEKTGLWTLKGSTVIKDEHEVMMRKHRIADLQNDYFYRFSIIPSNKRHKGNESPLSNIVKVEVALTLLSSLLSPLLILLYGQAPLPIHWYKVYPKTNATNNKNMQFYYQNMKSGKVLHHRPDEDPKYIDETIRRLFRYSYYWSPHHSPIIIIIIILSHY